MTIHGPWLMYTLIREFDNLKKNLLNIYKNVYIDNTIIMYPQKFVNFNFSFFYIYREEYTPIPSVYVL